MHENQYSLSKEHLVGIMNINFLLSRHIRNVFGLGVVWHTIALNIQLNLFTKETLKINSNYQTKWIKGTKYK